MKRKYFFFLFIPLLLWALYFNLYQEDSKTFVPTTGNTITYILIDGLSSSIFFKTIEQGRLPNIKALMDSSLVVENGVSSCPTMTGYAFYPFLTGHDAVESGIYGLRWFDKQRLKGNLRNYVGRTNVQMNKDIVPDIKTAFELAGDQYTCSINTYMNRGVGESVKTGFAHTTAKYEGHHWFTQVRHVPGIGKNLSKDHFQHESDVTDIAIEQLKKNPKVQWITYPSPDAYNHVNGTDSVYTNLLIHLDHEIGRLRKAMSDLGQHRRAIALISDHGISDVHKNLDLCQSLSPYGLKMERGKSASFYSSNLVKDIKELKDLDAFFVINGNLSAYIYLNMGKENFTWGKKCLAGDMENFRLKNGKKIDLPKLLSLQEGIELVNYQLDDSTAVVLNRKGKALISSHKDNFSYTVIQGNDPLGYTESAAMRLFVNSGYHHQDSFFLRSMATDFPDAVKRIYNLCMAKKSGDIFITSMKGYDLASNYEVIVDNYKGGHGGIRKEIILVPFILYRPGFIPEKIESLRSEDLGKKILTYVFGKKQ